MRIPASTHAAVTEDCPALWGPPTCSRPLCSLDNLGDPSIGYSLSAKTIFIEFMEIIL